MRLLTTFLTIILFFLFVLGVGFYFTREYFLYRGVENFKKAVLVLQRSGTATTTCSERAPDLLGLIDPGAESIAQIRFTSSTDYVLEMLCAGYSFAPLTLEERTLDSYVTKLSGTSGIILGAERTGVELGVFEKLEDEINQIFDTDWTFIQKNRTIVLENNQFVVSQPDKDLGAGPVASCEGFGYQCCQMDAQIGVGDPLLGAVGCEQSCYSTCVRRPLVLSLNSNPFYDVQTRTLSVNSGESVDFAYVIDTGTSETVHVSIDFGDGSIEQSIEKTATFSHVYNCMADACEYTVNVLASDAFGTQSAITAVSQLKVQVRGANN